MFKCINDKIMFKWKKNVLFNKYMDLQATKYKCSVYKSYQNVVDSVNIALENNDTIEDKIISLDYIITMLKIDMQSEVLSDIIYKTPDDKRKGPENIDRNIFPSAYLDDKGKKIDIELDEKNQKEISLRKDFVYSFPFCKKRIIDKVIHIRKCGFKYKDDNHMANYYTIIDMCVVYNGNHSIASGIYNKMGTIKANVFDTTPLLKYIYTNDGLYWYNTYDNSKIEKIKDFRIGIIFEIVKLREKIKKNDMTDLEKIEEEETEIEVEKDPEPIYNGVLMEKYYEGVNVGEKLGKIKGEVEGMIQGRANGIIELGIKYNIPKDALYDEVIKEYKMSQSEFDSLYKKINEKSKYTVPSGDMKIN